MYFPVALSAFKIATALLTGNTMVLKPSPFAAFGGRKQPSMRVENGIEGLMAYTEPKTFLVAG